MHDLGRGHLAFDVPPLGDELRHAVELRLQFPPPLELLDGHAQVVQRLVDQRNVALPQALRWSAPPPLELLDGRQNGVSKPPDTRAALLHPIVRRSQPLERSSGPDGLVHFPMTL
jgi:hypothetical protein